MKDHRQKITFYTDDLVGIFEAAKILGVSRQTIHTGINEGKLLTFKVGSNRYLYRNEIERWRPVKRGFES
jgi:excisionase family DNA binding protein